MFPIRDDAPRLSFPYVNWVIILLNTAVFLYEWSLPRAYLDHVLLPALGLNGARYLAFLQGAPIPLAALLIPIFTSMFLHGGWLHLLGNMWMLYIFGDNVEDVFGHSRYLLFYLACGTAAALVQVAFSLSSSVPMIGASGAIAGVMGAYLLRFPRARVLTLVFLFVIFFFWNIPAWVILGYWFLVQALSGIGSMAGGATGGIAWFAHVGGFLAGMLLMSLLQHPRRSYE